MKPKEAKAVLLGLLGSAISRADDDLARARMAFRGKSAEQMQENWGQSDKTCQEILDDYTDYRGKLQGVQTWLASL